MNSTIKNNFSSQAHTYAGKLAINVFNQTIGIPLDNAEILIKNRTTGKTIEKLNSNINGNVPEIELPTPDLEHSLNKNSNYMPYSEYDISVTYPNLMTTNINAIQLLPNCTAQQNVFMEPVKILSQKISEKNNNTTTIKEHTLWANYPPKTPELEIKPEKESSGFVVLNKPVIPEYISVHDGLPNDTSAINYYVPFKDYIKNVASSEIYATWPKATIEANILAIISFTLNRVYTEWYRAKGKNFTITSSTAYDHAYFHNRNLYTEISTSVDKLFANYVSKPNIVQPLFTQYCDGKNSQCSKWMTQWGSKDLGDKGYSNIAILKHYYGYDVYLTAASQVNGIPSSFPGSNLSVGSTGNNVKIIQNQLNSISNNYPAIKKVASDGIFGANTSNSIKTFQKIFNMPVSGIIDYPTWYKISDVYVAIAKLA